MKTAKLCERRPRLGALGCHDVSKSLRLHCCQTQLRWCYALSTAKAVASHARGTPVWENYKSAWQGANRETGCHPESHSSQSKEARHGLRSTSDQDNDLKRQRVMIMHSHVLYIMPKQPIQKLTHKTPQSYQIAFIPNPGSLTSKCATLPKNSSCHR